MTTSVTPLRINAGETVRGTLPLRSAGAALVAGAAVHAAAYLAGPRWMALLGAPPSIVASAHQGSWAAPTGTAAIITLLATLALYCFASAREGTRLSLARPVLALAAMALILRGLLVVPVVLAGTREWSTPLGRFVVSGSLPVFVAGSVTVLVTGLLIALGLVLSRARLAERTIDQPPGTAVRTRP